MNNIHYKGIFVMILSSICACIGQILWKLSSARNLLLVIVGFILYGFGALLMIIAYRYGEVSRLQPLQSINYISSIFIGYFAFSEIISLNKICGVIFITIGIIVLCSEGKKI